jgi:hypothetical protein
LFHPLILPSPSTGPGSIGRNEVNCHLIFFEKLIFDEVIFEKVIFDTLIFDEVTNPRFLCCSTVFKRGNAELEMMVVLPIRRK